MKLEKSKNDSQMGSPLQSSCRSEACSPSVGQKVLLRRRIPLSARASPRAGRTLPWHARCCFALRTHSSAPLQSPAALGAPAQSIQVQPHTRSSAGTRRKFNTKNIYWKIKKIQMSGWEGQQSLLKGEGETLEGAAPLAPLNQWASFSGSPVEEIPHTDCWWKQHGAQRSGLPANSAGAAQRRAGCRLQEPSARRHAPKPDTDLQIHWLGVVNAH